MIVTDLRLSVAGLDFQHRVRITALITVVVFQTEHPIRTEFAAFADFPGDSKLVTGTDALLVQLVHQIVKGHLNVFDLDYLH